VNWVKNCHISEITSVRSLFILADVILNYIIIAYFEKYKIRGIITAGIKRNH